jgi:23S rRNA (cytidine1920-2'-O)/16S rRNA (cytidine1409-2'-O)-methyltransferase
LQGLASSREKAKALIMAGQVFEGTNRIEKAGEMIGKDKALRVKGQGMPYVSRGGLKLAKALEVFPIGLIGKTVLDIGASTGGFTDCALQHGAAKVYAVDVGYGQMDWKLRQDPRVVVMEKTNARYLTLEALGEPVDFVTIDVSFISIDKIMPILPSVMKGDGSGVALVKPQFEAGREHVGRKGVIHDPAIHRQVLAKIRAASAAAGLEAYGLTWSPIKGPEGNIEYLWWFGIPVSPSLPENRDPMWHMPEDCGAAVEEAFQVLSQRTGSNEKDSVPH